MSRISCELEAAVLAAVRVERWPAALREHLRTCGPCADTLLAARLCARLGEEDAPFLPSPAGQVWWRAMRRARLEDLERVTRPITLLRRLTWTTGAAGAAALAVWGWPLVAARLPDLESVWEPLAGAPLSPLGSMVAAGTAALSLVIVAIFSLWSEE